MRKPLSLVLKTLTYLSVAITIFALFWILCYILIRGFSAFHWSLIFGPYSADNPSMSFAILTTIIMIILTLLISTPISVASAIFLTEYAKRGNKLVKYIRLATETLAGIPSIVYGLFGAIFFGTVLNLGYSILTGCLTLSIMLLPVIIRQTEESIKSVPDMYREGSFGLGASKLRTILKILFRYFSNFLGNMNSAF